MYIKKTPKNYCGALSPVVYTIADADPNEIIEIEIMDPDSETVLGVKRLYGEVEYNLNVANYFKSIITPAPLLGVPGFSRLSSRITQSGIRMDGISSPRTIVTAGSIECESREKLSGAAGVATIALGETDEIAFIAPAGKIIATGLFYGKKETTDFKLETHVSGGLYVLAVDMTALSKFVDLEGYDQMTITLEDNTGVFISQRYRLTPQRKKSVRISWQNTYGQFDYYTFDLQRINRETTRSETRLSGGYETVGIECELTYELVSQFEPAKTIEWLSQLLASPRVLMIENGKAVPVSVKTSHGTIKGIGPQNLQIKVCRIM